MQFYFILSLVISILIIIFAISNAASVPVSFIFVKYELSLALIIFISAALGAIIAVLIGFVKQFKLRKQIKKLELNFHTMEQENKNLQEKISLLQTIDHEVSTLNNDQDSEEVEEH